MIPGLMPALVAAYLCLLGPGQAWLQLRGSEYPQLLARLAVSVLWTTVLGLGLAAFGTFSLPRLIVINGAVTLAGYLLVGRVRDAGAPRPERPIALPLILVATFCFYWPPFSTFLGASDSVTYTSAGVHLARYGSIEKEDDLAPLLSPGVRRQLFTSALDNPFKPPFMRHPGGVIIAEKLDSRAHPSFFPAPSVWSAVCADALGPRYAGAYATLFAALAVAAVWAFARRLLPGGSALAVALVVALNAASYWSARMPLSEPLAWFFLWVGLGSLDCWDRDGLPADVRLACATLGAAGLVRVEFALFVPCLLAIRYLMPLYWGGRRPSPVMFVFLAAMLGMTAIQASSLYGAYTVPFAEALRAVEVRAQLIWNESPALFSGFIVAAVIGVGWSARRHGPFRTTVATGLVAIGLVYTVWLSEWRGGQTASWLIGYAGIPAAIAAACGAIASHRRLGSGRLLLATLTALGGFVLYDPHVLPYLPWGARRLVPVVLPAVFLLAGVAIAALGRRHPIPAGAAWALVIAFALLPAKPLLARDFYGGGYRQLAELDQMIPREGTLLIDRSVGEQIIGTGLWFAFDRNSLPVDVSTRRGRQLIAVVVSQLASRGPCYLLKSGSIADSNIAFVAQRIAGEMVLETLFPRIDDRQPPRSAELLVTTVVLRELRPLRLRPEARRTPSE